MRCAIAVSVILASPAFLGGCYTFDEAAQPERFMGLTCAQLSELAQSYRSSAQDLVQNQGVAGLSRNEDVGNDISEAIFQNDTSLDQQIKRDARSIALARRKKGCE